MKKEVLFQLETPYREPFTIEGFAFGNKNAEVRIAVIGSVRGNEVQQTYIAASLVNRLAALEAQGGITNDAYILVVPSANSFSMNISKRFWPLDNTDINRMFPGYDAGETTQRIAAGLFDVIKDFTYGMQLCSFYLPGNFMPHVRVTETGVMDMDEALGLATKFGFPYALQKTPSPFDTTTLNYNWQVWEAHAFSLYSSQTDAIDERTALFTEDCILRFLSAVGALQTGAVPSETPIVPGQKATNTDLARLGFKTKLCREDDLLDVLTHRAGFFRQLAETSAAVDKGEVLAQVVSCSDGSVVEELVSPVQGRVFFNHAASLINEHTIAFRIVPDNI